MQPIAELQQKEVWTIDELVFYSGIKKSYIYKLTMFKKIPYYKPNGKSIFFKRDEILNWLLSNRYSTSEEIKIKAATYVTLKSSR